MTDTVNVPLEPSAGIKTFDPTTLASITTGVLLTDFSQFHEAAEWLIGHPIWTHEFPSLRGRLSEIVLAQFPQMPTEIATDWTATRDQVLAQYGTTVEVRQGADIRTAGPLTTAASALAQGKGA